MGKAKQRLNAALHRYQRHTELQNGVLGNVAGIVAVPNKANMVYVTVSGSGVREVYNKRVPLVPGLPVHIGYDPLEPKIYQVLDSVSYPQANYNAYQTINGSTTHGASHNWAGTDPVFIEKRQLMPLRATPMGSMQVYVGRDTVWMGDEWIYYTGHSINLSSLVPITGSRYALIYANETGGSGILTGTVRDLQTLVLSDVPAPLPGTVPIAVIRLYAGQTAIQEGLTDTDVVDVRRIFDPISTGSFGGAITEAMLSLSDNTTADVSTTKHGFMPKLDGNSSHFLNGAGNWVGVTGAGGTPAHSYYDHLAALLEPDALEVFQKDTFTYMVTGSNTRYLLASWNTRLSTSGRLEIRDPQIPFPMHGVTLTGLDTGASAVILNPDYPIYADSWTKYYDRLFYLATHTPRYLPITAAETSYTFLPGAYGAIITRITNFDFTWIVGRFGGIGFNLGNEVSDATVQRLDNALNLPVNKFVINEVESGVGTAGNLGGIVYHLLPSDWSGVSDPNTYDFRDDFMGNSLDTATNWNRNVDTVGNIEIDSQFQWLKVIGGANWGDDGIFSQTGISRANGKVFLCDIFVPAGSPVNTNMLVGFHDGGGYSNTDMAHGVDFTESGGNGVLQIFENGTSRGTVGSGWAVKTTYRLRITLTSGSDAVYEIQGGVYAPIGGSAWTDITPGTTSSATNTLYAGVIKKDTRIAYVGDVRIY